MINLSYTIFKCFGRLTLKPPSFSEKEAKTKAPALSFGHILPSANIIKSNPSLFYKKSWRTRHRRILNSKLLRNFATPCGFSLRSGRLTVLIWNLPVKNLQIL